MDRQEDDLVTRLTKLLASFTCIDIELSSGHCR